MRKLFNKILKKKKIVAVILFIAIALTSSVFTIRFKDSYAKQKSYSCVETYQRWLNEKYNAKLDADGVYGCNTAKATIKAIQKAYNKCYGTNLEVDGYWGQEMHEKIHKIKIKRGTCNEVVEMWQRVYNYVYNRDDRLANITIDGCFGQETENAIKKMGNCNGMGSYDCTKACNGNVIDSHRWQIAECSCAGEVYGCAKSGSVH